MLAYTLTVDALPVLLPGESKVKYDRPTEPVVFGENCVFKPSEVLKLLVRALFAVSSLLFGVVLEYVVVAKKFVNPVRRWL